MKIRAEWRVTLPARNSLFIRWSRYLLFALGVVLLSYVGFVLLDARLFQAAQSRQFQRLLNISKPLIGSDEQLEPRVPPSDVASADGERADSRDPVHQGESSLGRIEIGTLGLDAMVLEGTDSRTLRRAVGHIPGTPLPGQPGNVVITGHRDTFFRPLHKIRKDDEITLTTLNGSYRYVVDSIEVVEPDDTEALGASDDSVLTLVTCYPFYFVGPAPRRFVVRAHLITGLTSTPAAQKASMREQM
jgi:sortase A